VNRTCKIRECERIVEAQTELENDLKDFLGQVSTIESHQENFGRFRDGRKIVFYVLLEGLPRQWEL
jgi:hypothetical protein